MIASDKRTARLLHALYGERNGAVADQMRALGLVYPENWGVSLSAIRRIARTFRDENTHAWARELWQQPHRELRLAALWLADREQLSAEIDFWTPDTRELADELIFVLGTKRCLT